MKFVYILESETGRHFYVWLADDVALRLEKHNRGEVPHTSKYAPWRLRTFVGFAEPEKAVAFERYLKSGSGRAFSTRHF